MSVDPRKPRTSERTEAHATVDASGGVTIRNDGTSGPVTNTVDRSVRVRNVAVGGGLALAVVVAVVWWQWSSRADAASAEQEYRALGSTACERIAASLTLPLPELDSANASYRTSTLVSTLQSAQATIEVQRDRVTAADAPGGLTDERDAVAAAADDASVAIAALAADLPQHGETIPFDAVLSSLWATQLGQQAQTAEAALADALSDLAGEPCSLTGS